MIGRTNSGTINVIAPDGLTVTPTDNYKTWLYCAGLSSNGYANLAAVIADSTARSVLCNNLNALRYMVRSATIITAVLADSGWVTALDGSTYAVTIPTMTSDTAPSGVASASSVYLAGWEAFKAFDKSTSTKWGPIADALNAWLEFLFPQNTFVYKSAYTNYSNAGFNGVTFKIQGYIDSAWDDLITVTPATTINIVTTSLISDLINASKYRLLFTTSGSLVVTEWQLYGLNLN